MTTAVEKPLSDDVIRRALNEFNVSASPDQVACIQSFIRLLRQWNEKLNLTAIRDPLEILHRHFCESMFAATAIPLSSGRLADIGSGPGFPGLPLKIIQPELNVFLVESNIKKGTFIAEVIRELGLNGARVLISRYEELGEEVAPLDYVCSRALGEFESFLNWAGSDRVAAGRVILWVGGRDLEDVRKSALWDWQEPIAIPNSLRRFLLVGTKKPQLSA
jgi:16S rRNA (guanine527-N7)-methyltransferase